MPVPFAMISPVEETVTVEAVKPSGKTVVAPPMVAAMLNPQRAHALSSDIVAMKAVADCNISGGAGKIPFICFDLAGGANIAGSNVLIGQAGGHLGAVGIFWEVEK